MKEIQDLLATTEKFTVITTDLLKSTRDLQKEQLAKLSKEELLKVAGELVSYAESKELQFPATLKENMRSKLPPITLVQGLTQLLSKFPEVPDERLALDRKFNNQKDRINAIVDDLNKNRIPDSRLHELLHENYFESDTEYSENGKEKDIVVSRMFLAYALPKINNLYSFLEKLQTTLGNREFEQYMRMPNILSDGRVVSVDDLYLKDFGNINLEERAALSADAKRDLALFIPRDKTKTIVEVANVDTHNVASHKSADESHVTAFKMMLNAHPELRVNAKYTAPQKNTDPSREVKIVNKGNLDQFVADKTRELQRDVNNLLSMNDAEIYNNYLRYNDIERFKKVEYKDLEDSDRREFNTKINGWKFKAEAAKRYLDDMINNHKFKGGYEYRSDVAASSGLTMEQMVATSYWAS
jgi:hypothetical protein